MHQHLDRISGRVRLRHRDAARDAAGLPDPSLPAGADRCPQVRHIVLLMMENHSYDNYLGTLGRGDGFPAEPIVNLAADGTAVRIHHFASTQQHPELPSQSWRASHLQYDDGRNDGFVRAVQDIDPHSDGSVAMGYWDADDLPFYSALARTFPLADRWFSSCLGPTFPNRRFLLAATANGLIDDTLLSVVDYPKTGTIFDLLNRHGISWANYHHVPTKHLLTRRIGGTARVRLARSAKLAFGRVEPDVNHRLRGEVQCTANLYPLGLLRTVGHLRHVRQFLADARAGTLPAVSIVDPDYTTCSEENPQDVHAGEGFAARIIDAVMRGPGWPHTLLIWCYDEHGGYYDHVPPPAAVEPDDVRPQSVLDTHGAAGWLLRRLPLWQRLRKVDDSPARRYDRYGFRVPAVVVSPYAKADFVCSTVFDHTSALKLIEEKWNLPPLTRRDAAAVAPWDMLDFSREPSFLDPPALPPPARAWQP